MKIPGKTRGTTNIGWLESAHSFSFGRWFDPDRMQYRSLRVINDDLIKSGGGFGTHPHDNMEIITYMLRGTVEHEDSVGNKELLRAGEVQVMSAGSSLTQWLCFRN